MATTYSFPTNASLKLIAQVKVPVLTMQDPIFEYFPIRTENSDTVLWEQKDDFRGLQNVRGIGGQFGVVKRVSLNRFSVIPGYYGDDAIIDETDLTRLRSPGQFGAKIDARQLVLERQEHLLNREIDGFRYAAWQIAQGRFTRADAATGAILHTDVFALQSYQGSNWFDLTNGTPLKDMRAMKPLARAKGTRFDKTARLFLNTNTVNAMLNNNNANDLGGKRSLNGSTLSLTLDQVNEILVANDLPMIVEYDDGYVDENKVYQPYIPDGQGVLFGKRIDGAPLGGIVQTINASNPGQAPGPYDGAFESEKAPKVIVVQRGVNYAPIVEYPGSIVRLGCGPSALPVLA